MHSVVFPHSLQRQTSQPNTITTTTGRFPGPARDRQRFADPSVPGGVAGWLPPKHSLLFLKRGKPRQRGSLAHGRFPDPRASIRPTARTGGVDGDGGALEDRLAAGRPRGRPPGGPSPQNPVTKNWITPSTLPCLINPTSTCQDRRRRKEDPMAGGVDGPRDLEPATPKSPPGTSSSARESAAWRRTLWGGATLLDKQARQLSISGRNRASLYVYEGVPKAAGNGRRRILLPSTEKEAGGATGAHRRLRQGPRGGRRARGFVGGPTRSPRPRPPPRRRARWRRRRRRRRRRGGDPPGAMWRGAGVPQGRW